MYIALVVKLFAGLVALGLAGCGLAGTGRPSAAAAQLTPGQSIEVAADQLQVLPDSEAVFSEIGRLIDGARQSIEVEMYEFGRPDIAGRLIAAHQRGLAVTVIDDPTVDVTRVTAAVLRRQGVTVIDYPVRPQMIDHVKLLIVDSGVAVVGGINWGAQSNANHDYDVEVRGPVVTNLERVYKSDLNTAEVPVSIPDAAVDPQITVLSTLPADQIRPVALQLISEAQSSIDLDLYVLTDSQIVNALEVAQARGVVVKLLLDPSQRPSDPAAAELSAAGISVRLYRSSGELLHAKVMVTDKRNVLFGSANWSLGGFERNHEIDLSIPNNPAVASDFLAQMDSDWQASG